MQENRFILRRALCLGERHIPAMETLGRVAAPPLAHQLTRNEGTFRIHYARFDHRAIPPALTLAGAFLMSHALGRFLPT